MAVPYTPIDNGTIAGDGTGENAFLAFARANSNQVSANDAIEELQGRFWTLDDTARSLALGERVQAETHAGIAYTLPATFARSATSFSDIWVWNADSDSDITLTPASGDELFIKGTGLGVDATQAIISGDLVIISPRVTDTSWDVIIVGAGTTNMSTISDTKANFNTALSDGTFMYVGDAPTAHNQAWSTITTTPTIMSGYGISDNKTNFNTALSDGTFMFVGDAPTAHNQAWSTITATPTILSGYGISDTKVNFNTALSDGSFMFVGDAPTAHNQAWSTITGTPTILSGYGISDTKVNFNTALSDGSFMFAGDAPTAHNHTTATAGFTVTGAITATGDITAFFSDDRLKTKDGNITDALDLINCLNGFYYRGNGVAKSFGYDDTEIRMGLSAQEVEAIIPTAVHLAPFDTDKDGSSKSGENYKTVQYEKVIPLLVEAVKQLSQKVEVLEVRV